MIFTRITLCRTEYNVFCNIILVSLDLQSVVQTSVNLLNVILMSGILLSIILYTVIFLHVILVRCYSTQGHFDVLFC
jgi:hypothetical protein